MNTVQCVEGFLLSKLNIRSLFLLFAGDVNLITCEKFCQAFLFLQGKRISLCSRATELFNILFPMSDFN